MIGSSRTRLQTLGSADRVDLSKRLRQAQPDNRAQMKKAATLAQKLQRLRQTANHNYAV
jgi:hypothetical protein